MYKLFYQLFPLQDCSLRKLSKLCKDFDNRIYFSEKRKTRKELKGPTRENWLRKLQHVFEMKKYKSYMIIKYTSRICIVNGKCSQYIFK